MFRGVAHLQFSAGMFIRELPVHGCSVGNSPLGATSDQSPVNLRLIGGAHELTNQSYLRSSGRISANFNALLSKAPKSTQASSEKPNQKVRKNGCWLRPIFGPKIPAQVLVRAQVKIRFKWIFDRIRVCVTIANYVCTSCYWRQQIYWLSFCFRPYIYIHIYCVRVPTASWNNERAFDAANKFAEFSLTKVMKHRNNRRSNYSTFTWRNVA